MSRFNLLDEPWISVIVDEKGHNKLVSITDVFKHASEYKALAGDMKTQDFVLLRILLAVLHTVFSRYDIQGNSREFDSNCLLYTSPSPRDLSTSRMPSSA